MITMALLVNVMAVTCFIRANDKTVDFKQKPFIFDCSRHLSLQEKYGTKVKISLTSYSVGKLA